MPVSLEEKIDILVLLCEDKDEETRNTAFYTLQTWHVSELQKVLSNPSTSWTVLDFFSSYLAAGHKEITEALLQNPGLPEDLRDWLLSLPIRTAEAETFSAAPTPITLQEGIEEGPKEGIRETLLQKISRMSVAEKTKRALAGSQEERLVLIRDANKIVASAVLQSPKLTDPEIENFASMKSVTEDVLRLIAANRKYMKNHSVARALVNNPRCPIDITLPLFRRLNDRDLKELSVNRDVADVLRTMALKLIKQKQLAQRVKIPTGKH